MPATKRSPTSDTKQLTYGPLFESHAQKNELERGKIWVQDALRVLKERDPQNATLRKLPLTSSQRKTLLKRSIDFLQVNQDGPFEEDNLKHVGRLISNMKVHGSTLSEYLEMESEDVQLLAALHDLGKAKIPSEMAAYLSTIFPKDDFLNIRVLPHELFSFYWIERLGSEVGLSSEVRQVLMDQTANHNLGPDLSDPENSFLLAKNTNGTYRHWWVEHWRHWSLRVRTAGLDVIEPYGHTVSPLANTLVLFDRIDGGHPHSWEKFLNQDLLTGALTFSASSIVQVMEHANSTAREQLKAVGRELKSHFVAHHALKLPTDLPPLSQAHAMLDKNMLIVERLRESNDKSHYKKFKVFQANCILYQDNEQVWFRFESTPELSRSFQWNGNGWSPLKTSSNPVSLLLSVVYSDWH